MEQLRGNGFSTTPVAYCVQPVLQRLDIPLGHLDVRGQPVEIRTHDVVIRHLRFRPGDLSGAEVDGLTVGSGSRRVIVDHCSAGWSVDESLSLAGDVADTTVQWCLIAEALNHSVHRKGPHGYGSLMRATGGVTLATVRAALLEARAHGNLAAGIAPESGKAAVGAMSHPSAG